MSDLDDKLAELQAKKTAADKARAIARQAREVEELELEFQYEAELGARGSQFEIIDSGDLGEGFIVVKLGAEVLFKRFTASKMTTEDIEKLVIPCVVHPTKEKLLEIIERRPALAVRAANALATLYGMKSEANAGK